MPKVYTLLPPDYKLNYGDTIYFNMSPKSGGKYQNMILRGRYRKPEYRFDETEEEFDDYKRLIKKYLAEGWLYKREIV